MFWHEYAKIPRHTSQNSFHCRRQSGMNFGYVTVNEVNSNQKFDLIRKSILSILQTKNAYDIMPVGKMIRLNSFITQQKPQSCDL